MPWIIIHLRGLEKLKEILRSYPYPPNSGPHIYLLVNYFSGIPQSPISKPLC